MTNLRVLVASDAASANPTVTKSVPLPVGTTAVGRDLIGVADKRLSRKQLEVHVSDSGSVAVTRLGANE